MEEDKSKGCGCVISIAIAIMFILYIATYEVVYGVDKFGTIGDVALGIIIFVLIIAIIFAQYLINK